MLTTALDYPYIRLAIYILALVLIYMLVPKLWRLIVGFGTRNVRSEGERIKALERNIPEGEVHQDISREKIKLEDAEDTAEGILGHIREEWAKQSRH